MTVTLNPRLRLGLYVLTVIGTPVVVYLRASGIIGDLELGLWGAEVAAVSSLAALNTSTTTPTVGSAGMLSPQEIEHYQKVYERRQGVAESQSPGEHRAD